MSRNNSLEQVFLPGDADVAISTGSSAGDFKNVIRLMGDDETIKELSVVFDNRIFKHDTYIILDDNTKIVILGGLTCGYSGVGSGFLFELLKCIGVDDKMAEIVFDDSLLYGTLSFTRQL